MNIKFDLKFLLAIALIFICVATRLFNLPANFTPIMAVALFSGVFFADKRIALLIPFSAMLLSDIFLGFHSTMIAVYFSFAVIVFLGMQMKNVSIKRVLGNSILGAVLFFLITNFGC